MDLSMIKSQLPSEVATDRRFNFPDVDLKRQQDGSIQRSVHRKKTGSKLYMNVHSYIPLQQLCDPEKHVLSRLAGSNEK